MLGVHMHEALILGFRLSFSAPYSRGPNVSVPDPYSSSCCDVALWEVLSSSHSCVLLHFLQPRH